MDPRILINTQQAFERPADVAGLTGAAVASGEFCAFMAREGRLFDEIHLLARDASRPAPGSIPANTRFVTAREFPSVAPGYRHALLFSGSLTQGAYLRRRFLSCPAPIVWQGHAVSYFVGDELPFLDLLSDIRPYDCVLTSSRSHLASARRLYELAAEEVAPLLRGIGGPRFPRFEIIPPGVDTDVYRPGDVGAARRAMGLPPFATVLLSMSRIAISDKMDLLPLLRGFQKAFAHRPDVILVVAGQARGTNHAEVTQDLARKMGLGDDRVRFVPVRNASEAYQAADVFLAPSDTPSESFCLTAVEAMAGGIPVVVSDWDGLRDTVVEGETGFRIPTLWGRAHRHAEEIRLVAPWPQAHLFLGQSVAIDMDLFFRRVTELVDNPDLRRKMGEAGRRRIVENFDWHRLIPRYETLFADLMDEAAREGDTADPRRRGLGFFTVRPDPV